MAKITVQDDCLAPEQFIYLTYSGPDPWGVAKKISDSIKPFFHVAASKTAHERLNWDITGDPINFWSKWWVKREFSRYSKARITIILQGTKSKADNTGQFTLKVNANLDTTVLGPNILLRPFWATYSLLFYNRARRRYVESCKNLAVNFMNEIKEHYNLGKTQVTQAHTAFD